MLKLIKTATNAYPIIHTHIQWAKQLETKLETFVYQSMIPKLIKRVCNLLSGFSPLYEHKWFPSRVVRKASVQIP